MRAVLSDCSRYRYRLERDLAGGGDRTVAFIMVNPSTADAEIDDPTIRKVKGFALRMGAGRVIVGNLFAYRATDIKALRDAPDPVGIENDGHLRRILADAEVCVVAWGALSKLPPALRRRWAQFHDMATAAGASLKCLGVAKDGHPLHPCMIGYERPVLEWRRPCLTVS
ncbi:DUF1643 domain-containing protein [Methylobacterium aquaticum]|uniref:DUF1643 domain-containing protein n=1 Tax=Methylobacterium aquaticum TaxID=270351 RepID=A0A0C6FXP3_9HYPH|nr:DUF1643 domain-containing protein [Methylobacterium aquaticum]BAQ50349.1 hypothetical protein Maq22A_3p50505 [Methylobacterium aquaticum]